MCFVVSCVYIENIYYGTIKLDGVLFDIEEFEPGERGPFQRKARINYQSILISFSISTSIYRLVLVEVLSGILYG